MPRVLNPRRCGALDQGRIQAWENKEKKGDFLTRIAGIYLIWNPVKHKRMMIASGGPQSKEDRKLAGNGFPLTLSKAIQKTRKEHEDTLSEFESILSGIESAMKSGGLGPERMTHDQLFLEIKRSLSPLNPDTGELRSFPLATREISHREQLATISILGQTETYLNIDGLLWTFLSLKLPPDGTYPGILRQIMTIGFPLVISTQVVIPDQRVVLDRYKKNFARCRLRRRTRKEILGSTSQRKSRRRSSSRSSRRSSPLRSRPPE